MEDIIYVNLRSPGSFQLRDRLFGYLLACAESDEFGQQALSGRG